MKHKTISLTTKYTAIVCLFLIAAVTAVGAVLMIKSNSTTRSLLRRHMIAVSDTAAALVDGNFLERMTADDVGCEEYLRIAETLMLIKDAQKNNDIKYIYTVKLADSGDHFVFTIDPDPIAPAAFGNAVFKTVAQDTAWSGTSAADEEKYEDEWGCYYTAWSPIKNSAGKVVGLVGMDFAADWYDDQVDSHMRIVLILGLIALLGGLFIMFLLTSGLRRKFRMLSTEMSTLSENVMELAGEIKDPKKQSAPESEEAPIDAYGHDTLEQLGMKIREMKSKLQDYIDYIHEQAYYDVMTGVANKSAYLEKVAELNGSIGDGKASFAVAVFDINDLKGTNDVYGHEFGDMIIIDAANIIKRVFPQEAIYRIGGDEFIALLPGVAKEALDEKLSELDRELDGFNANEKKYEMTLSISRGGAVFIPGSDADFKDTFKRADQDMYENKREHYLKFDRRRRDPLDEN